MSDELIPAPCRGCRFAAAIPNAYYIRCTWKPDRAAMWFDADAAGLRVRRLWSSPRFDPTETCDVRVPAPQGAARDE